MLVILQADLITHFLQHTNKKISMLITEGVLLHYKKIKKYVHLYTVAFSAVK